MEQPLVSVIIPTYNSAGTIERCLKSVQAQLYPNIEIIVVDNFSSDETPRIAAQYATVIQAGPERSAQVNIGVKQARGKYVYRIDGDFELSQGLIQSAVNRIEDNGPDAGREDKLNALVIPNRSVGNSFWARVRALERDTYLGDTLMGAARFWLRDLFLSLGGFDETLTACEDLDLHNRLLEHGCKIGWLSETEAEIHLGEKDRLSDYARQSFYYGPSILRYLRKAPRRGLKQSIPLRPSFLKHWRSFVHHPGLALGLLILRTVQTLFSLLGMLIEGLGLLDEHGRGSRDLLIGAAFVAISSVGLSGPLAYLGLPVTPLTLTLIALFGTIIWQVVGTSQAARTQIPRNKALLNTAVAYSPLFALLLIGRAGIGALNTYLYAILLALWVSWLSYLAKVNPQGGRWDRFAAGLVVACALLFVALYSGRSILRLQTFQEDGYNLAVYDQALWRTAASLRTGTSIAPPLYSSIIGHSLLADGGALILFLWVPVYLLGIGGPAALLIVQWLAIAAVALLLFKQGHRQLGAVPSALVSLAYLGYGVTQRIGQGPLNPVSLGPPLILLALEAYFRQRRITYFLLCILASLCGVEIGLVVSALGLGLLLTSPLRRQDGWFTLILGLGWTWIGSDVLPSYFGGTAGQFFAPYLPPAQADMLRYYLSQIFSLHSLAYFLQSLAPLVFLPVFGLTAWMLGWRRRTDSGPVHFPYLLLALPGLVMNLCGQSPAYTSLNGVFELTTLPFLFAASVDGLAVWKNQRKPDKEAPVFALSSFILVACLSTSLLWGAPVFKGFDVLRVGQHQTAGQEVFRQIPQEASLSTQNPLSVPLAHRFAITIFPNLMPDGSDPDYILMDVFHPGWQPYATQYLQILWQALNNPSYQLETVTNGYLLFNRGQQTTPGDNIEKLALAPDSMPITFPASVNLGNQVRYVGMNLSATEIRANEAFYLTTFWKCLSPLSKPYQSFLTYPGSRRFEDFVLGFYPPTSWTAGQVVRQEQAVTLPNLPDGDQYELVVGMWYDSGEPTLTSSEQLLGKDVIRLASISARDGQYKIFPKDLSGEQQ